MDSHGQLVMKQTWFQNTGYCNNKQSRKAIKHDNDADEGDTEPSWGSSWVFFVLSFTWFSLWVELWKDESPSFHTWRNFHHLETDGDPRRSGGMLFWGSLPEVFAIFVGSFWTYGNNRNSEGFYSAYVFLLGSFLWVLRTPQLRRKMWLKYLSSWILGFAKKRVFFSRRRIENGDSFGGSLVKVG